MRIALINLTGGGISGGYRKYLKNVIPRMAVDPSVSALMCAAPESLHLHDWLPVIPEVEFIHCKIFRTLSPRFDFELERRLARFMPDVIFVPVERYFRFRNAPVVNMVQNMEPFVSICGANPVVEMPGLLSRFIHGRFALKRADRIIGVSKFVSDFLVHRWGMPKEKIGVVYHGIDVVEGNSSRRPPMVLSDWQGDFFFTAGSIRPARGLDDALGAMKYLAARNKNQARLVIAGDTSPTMRGYARKLKEWVRRHNLASSVCWVGNIDSEEMRWCFEHCRGFLMTSRVESFGMIGGEAMAHGCHCIAADNPCLPEVFEDAALYYPPGDGEALGRAIQEILGWDKIRSDRARMRARNQAAKFSWDVCAKKTVSELAQAVEAGRGKGI